MWSGFLLYVVYISQPGVIHYKIYTATQNNTHMNIPLLHCDLTGRHATVNIVVGVCVYVVYYIQRGELADMRQCKKYWFYIAQRSRILHMTVSYLIRCTLLSATDCYTRVRACPFSELAARMFVHNSGAITTFSIIWVEYVHNFLTKNKTNLYANNLFLKQLHD